MSEHMRCRNARSASARRSSQLIAAAVAILVAACSGTNAPAPSTATAVPAETSTPATAAPSVASADPSQGAFERPSPSPVASTAMEPEPEALWTAAGEPKGEPYVSQPSIDPQGRVWTASSFDHVFWIIDRDGNVVESWGGAGQGDGDGELNLVAEGNGGGDIVFRDDGGFYVADTGNARIQRFDADRGFVGSFGDFGTDDGQFVRPYDIDLDAAGNVYVYDVARNDVQVFSEDGEFQRIAATQVGPYAAADDEGNVYAVDNDNGVILYRYTPAGKVDLAVGVQTLLPFATGLVVGPSGDLFMSGSDNGGSAPRYTSLLQFDAEGELQNVWPVGAESIGVDPSGDRVYLANGNDFEGAVRAYALTTD